MMRFRGAKLVASTNELTPDSIQEALRVLLQPIKNDDPRLYFYTMYGRETMEYYTDYMKNHNEDLNTNLIRDRPLELYASGSRLRIPQPDSFTRRDTATFYHGPTRPSVSAPESTDHVVNPSTARQSLKDPNNFPGRAHGYRGLIRANAYGPGDA